MDFSIIVCLYSKNHYEWLRKGARRPAWWYQPEQRAPFLCEEALLARGSFRLMQLWGKPREGECGRKEARAGLSRVQ
jgi:hypothetical protein